ncbi:MAG: DUF2911 domain-containing protein [Cyclobacteriaceae bacterium]|nr:DUF2911 domain-containing protein [Cyclobacteriaceae bacterium]
MKKKYALLSVLAFIIACSEIAVAQVKLPAASPLTQIKTSVGLTDVEISYSRPLAKGRKIFGEVVPFDQVWRTGANMATKIGFSDDVQIEGKMLPKGTYALFTIPREKTWTIIFNKNPNQWGTGDYKESENALVFDVKPQLLPNSTESFTIQFNPVSNRTAEMILSWSNTVVSFGISADIDERIMKSIETSFQINPSDYYNAALYYHETDRELDKALTWMNQALEIWTKQGNEPYWVYYRKALLLKDMKKTNEAMETAKKARALALKAGNDEYVKFNDKIIQDLQ